MQMQEEMFKLWIEDGRWPWRSWTGHSDLRPTFLKPSDGTRWIEVQGLWTVGSRSMRAMLSACRAELLVRLMQMSSQFGAVATARLL